MVETRKQEVKKKTDEEMDEQKEWLKEVMHASKRDNLKSFFETKRKMVVLSRKNKTMFLSECKDWGGTFSKGDGKTF